MGLRFFGLSFLRFLLLNFFVVSFRGILPSCTAVFAFAASVRFVLVFLVFSLCCFLLGLAAPTPDLLGAQGMQFRTEDLLE